MKHAWTITVEGLNDETPFMTIVRTCRRCHVVRRREIDVREVDDGASLGELDGELDSDECRPNGAAAK